MVFTAMCLKLGVVAMLTAQGNAVRRAFVWDFTKPVATLPFSLR